MQLTIDTLLRACSEQGDAAGISTTSVLLPLAGAHAPIKPAIYPGGKYQVEKRWWTIEDRLERTKVVVIDNVPSQANRLEAAMELLRGRLGLPEFVLDLSALAPLPAHIPAQLSSFRFPHRQADAYLRDSWLEGASFPKTDMGKELLSATADRPEALLQYFPQALLLGFWQSHIGKKRTQAKLARSMVCEIAGYAPANVDARQLGMKGDPLNLSVDEAVSFDPDDLLAGWQFSEGSTKSGGRKSKESLAEIGHGQVPVLETEAALTGVSFRSIEQRMTISIAGLRRVRMDTQEKSAAARALLVSLGVVAYVAAFSRPFSLRSGCDLCPQSQRWTWHARDKDVDLDTPTLEEAVTLFEECAKHAEGRGLPVGASWPSQPTVLQPSPELQKVIRATYPALD